MSELDWLSQLLQIITVTGQLEVRCAYGAPWRVTWNRAAPNEIPYHVIVRGRAIFEDPEARTRRELTSGDIVLLPHGAAHVLHDGSGQTPVPTQQRQGSAGWMLSENDSKMPSRNNVWHLDEVVISIGGRKHSLWRGIDQHGDVLDEVVHSRRDTKADKRLLHRLLKKQGLTHFPEASEGAQSQVRSDPTLTAAGD